MSKYVQKVRKSTTFFLDDPGFEKEGLILQGWNDSTDKTANPPKYQPEQLIEGGFSETTKLYACWGIDMTGAQMTIDPVQYSASDYSSTYTYSEKRPAVTVTSAGTELVQGTDYSVSYAGDSGTITHSVYGTLSNEASAFAVGIGVYAGMLSAVYKIIHTYNQQTYSLNFTASPTNAGTASTNDPSTSYVRTYAINNNVGYFLCYHTNSYGQSSTSNSYTAHGTESLTATYGLSLKSMNLHIIAYNYNDPSDTDYLDPSNTLTASSAITAGGAYLNESGSFGKFYESKSLGNGGSITNVYFIPYLTEDCTLIRNAYPNKILSDYVGQRNVIYLTGTFVSTYFAGVVANINVNSGSYTRLINNFIGQNGSGAWVAYNTHFYFDIQVNSYS